MKENDIGRSTVAVETVFRILYPTATCTLIMWALLWVLARLCGGNIELGFWLVVTLAIPMLIHYAWVSARWEWRVKDAESELGRAKGKHADELKNKQVEFEQEARRHVADVLGLARKLIATKVPKNDELTALINMLKGQRPPERSTITAAEYCRYLSARAEIDPTQYREALAEKDRLKSQLSQDSECFDLLADLLKGIVFQLVNTDFGAKNQLAAKMRRRIATTIFKVWGEKSKIWDFVATLCREQGIADVREEDQAK